jgi:hypothetical protein
MKAYFWILLLVEVLSLFDLKMTNPLDYIDNMVNVIGLIGLFGYVYNKQILTKNVWKIAFFVIVSWDVFYSIWTYHDEMGELAGYIRVIVTLLITLITLPYYIGLYKYSLKKTQV